MGALIGSAISKRIDNKGVEKILKVLLIVIILIDFYNVIKYTKICIVPDIFLASMFFKMQRIGCDSYVPGIHIG